ncbi:hypothetical protein BD769DRAFT_1390352 [Suillus cothurnatus]|nr:hypothetical protein BD769DRAFT_1390352 [Suillus cothurnatus]
MEGFCLQGGGVGIYTRMMLPWGGHHHNFLVTVILVACCKWGGLQSVNNSGDAAISKFWEQVITSAESFLLGTFSSGQCVITNTPFHFNVSESYHHHCLRRAILKVILPSGSPSMLLKVSDGYQFIVNNPVPNLHPSQT